MAKDGNDGVVVLDSGRNVYANCGIVGIDERGFVWEGYDGHVGGEDWTIEERRDFAALMIERWVAFAEFGPKVARDEEETE